MKQHTILLYTCTPPRENKDRLQNQTLIHTRGKNNNENPDVGQRAFLSHRELWLHLYLQRFRMHSPTAGGGWISTHSKTPEASGYTRHLPLPQIRATTWPSLLMQA
ncbi:UNVERIFIED_CONTAM: hypothetical protein K2H54_057911 [Gekko kuhli]